MATGAARHVHFGRPQIDAVFLGICNMASISECAGGISPLIQVPTEPSNQTTFAISSGWSRRSGGSALVGSSPGRRARRTQHRPERRAVPSLPRAPNLNDNIVRSALSEGVGHDQGASVGGEALGGGRADPA